MRVIFPLSIPPSQVLEMTEEPWALALQADVQQVHWAVRPGLLLPSPTCNNSRATLLLQLLQLLQQLILDVEDKTTQNKGKFLFPKPYF